MRNTTKYALILFAALAVLLLIGVIGRPAEGFSGSNSGVDSFTLYYADWCPHCQAVKPAFKEWSSGGSTTVGGKTVFLSMVEADTNPEKLKGKPVKGYPTFLLEKADGTVKEFDGERTPSGWTSWLAKNI